MMTIEEEIDALITFLKHPAGFDVGCSGILTIRPIDECSPPHRWEVDWEERLDHQICKFYKEFDNLEEAATFYVEKRRYSCLGLDFEKMAYEELKND